MKDRLFTGDVDMNTLSVTEPVAQYICVCGQPLNITGETTTDELLFLRFPARCDNKMCDHFGIALSCVRWGHNLTFKATEQE